MRQIQERLCVVLLIVARVHCLHVQKNNEDRCAKFTTCASCAGAHYGHDFMTEEESSLFSFEKSQSRGLLRSTSSSSLEWPHLRPSCVWCPLDQTCSSKSNPAECENDDNITVSLPYEYDCPLGPDPYPDMPPSLLPDWMGHLKASGGLDRLALVDLSLPGTHDSFTYDLSLTVSDDGLDQVRRIAEMLHTLSGGAIRLLPGELEEFFRLQAKTQHLTVTQQLDNGIRFLDARIMMDHDSKIWYSIHFMQSRNPIQHYFQEIRNWMDKHPEELVVVWLSRHGSPSDTGEAQYPGVSTEEKQTIWSNYTSIFGGLMLDTRVSSIHTTPVADLVHRGHRLVTFATDHDDFTSSSPFALNGAKIQNYYKGGGAFNLPTAMTSHLSYLETAAANNAQVREQKGFSLMSMNTEGTGWQITDAAKERFVHWFLGATPPSSQDATTVGGLFKSCAKHTQIPGLVHWCPETLLDIGQLTSFYNQVVIQSAYQLLDTNPHVAFPNAFYLDALDYDGTIRTGTQTLFGAERSPHGASHKNSKYAYVDTVLAYNARKACEVVHRQLYDQDSTLDSCNSTFMQTVVERRSHHPLQRWEEPAYGRRVDWPFL